MRRYYWYQKDEWLMLFYEWNYIIARFKIKKGSGCEVNIMAQRPVLKDSSFDSIGIRPYYVD